MGVGEMSLVQPAVGVEAGSSLRRTSFSYLVATPLSLGAAVRVALRRSREGAYPENCPRSVTVSSRLAAAAADRRRHHHRMVVRPVVAATSMLGRAPKCRPVRPDFKAIRAATGGLLVAAVRLAEEAVLSSQGKMVSARKAVQVAPVACSTFQARL